MASDTKGKDGILKAGKKVFWFIVKLLLQREKIILIVFNYLHNKRTEYSHLIIIIAKNLAIVLFMLFIGNSQAFK